MLKLFSVLRKLVEREGENFMATASSANTKSSRLSGARFVYILKMIKTSPLKGNNINENKHGLVCKENYKEAE
jgi:hypothetical protein